MVDDCTIIGGMGDEDDESDDDATVTTSRNWI